MGPVILLILLGILLILVETLLLPGFAITGILGICSVAAACWLAFTNNGTTAGIITILICIVLVTALIVFVLKSKTWKKATLNTNITSRTDANPEDKGIAVGDKGMTLTRLNPMGKARFGNVDVEVRSDEGYIDVHQQIYVRSIEGEKLFVGKQE